MPRIDVRMPSARYAVTIEPGLIGRVGDLVRAVAPSERAMLVADEALLELYVHPVQQSLVEAGYDVLIETIESDEVHKSLLSVSHLYGAALRGRLERTSPIIALGGGVIGDLAGFAAATFMRGVPLVQMPTTLLAMVDASIGGKTGVNLPMPNADEPLSVPLAKNLVGAFWQPRTVLSDPAVLRSLDRRQLACGLAECIKHAIIADETLFGYMAENISAIRSLETQVVLELIARCVQIKADIVAGDERETGRRAVLNLGHTFGHVIEPMPEFGLHHGEAVAIGLCAAAVCAQRLGRLDDSDVLRIKGLLDSAELPTQLPRPVPADPLMQAMRHDKKVQSGRLRLILPTSIGSAEVCDDVPESVVRAAWRAVGATG